MSAIFSSGFRKKTSPSRQFSTRFSLSVKSLFCLFQTHTNDIYWVCKSCTGEATNGPGKIKISPRTKEAKFSLAEGKNPPGRISQGLLQRGVQVSYLKAPEGFTLQRNCRREVFYKEADKLYIATVRR